MSVQSEPPVVLRKAGAATAAVLMSQFIDWSSANRKLSPIHRRLACLTRRKRPPYRRRSINVESATQRTCCHSRTDTAPASAAAGRRVGGGGRTCERPGGEKTGAPPPPTHTRPVDSNTSNLRGARFHHLHPFAGYIVSAHIASSFFRFFSGWGGARAGVIRTWWLLPTLKWRASSRRCRACVHCRSPASPCRGRADDALRPAFPRTSTEAATIVPSRR